jgi:hypothetical protein
MQSTTDALNRERPAPKPVEPPLRSAHNDPLGDTIATITAFIRARSKAD